MPRFPHKQRVFSPSPVLSRLIPSFSNTLSPYNYLPPSDLDGICTTDQYPSDYIAFSADGHTLQISNERLANIMEKLSQSEQRLLILRFVLELHDGEIGSRMCCSRSAIQRRRTSILRNMREQLTGKLP